MWNSPTTRINVTISLEFIFIFFYEDVITSIVVKSFSPPFCFSRDTCLSVLHYLSYSSYNKLVFFLTLGLLQCCSYLELLKYGLLYWVCIWSFWRHTEVYIVHGSYPFKHLFILPFLESCQCRLLLILQWKITHIPTTFSSYFFYTYIDMTSML